MNKFNQIIVSLLLLSLSFGACQDMLDVDSDKIVLEKENTMQSDSLYSMFGIFSQMQKLANSYVILGELRGELLEPGENASKYLKEIHNFDTYSADNPYTNNLSSYYTVINNCNYVIHNVDTAIISQGEKVMYKTMAAAKAARAWTYLQIVLNYGKAIYFEDPLTSIQDATKDYPSLTFDALAPKLIKDLEPFKETPDLWSSYTFISIPCLLGDLYLWTGQYEKAANTYRDLMYSGPYLMTASLQSRRVVAGTGENMAFSNVIDHYWYNIFYRGSGWISFLRSTNEYEQNYELNDLFFDRTLINSSSIREAFLIPSEKAIVNFDSAMYFHDYYLKNLELHALTTYGDLRKVGSILSYSNNGNYDARGAVSTDEYYFVSKYYYLNEHQYSTENYNQPETSPNFVLLHRTGLLYLRYAEAVNRIGKPNLAMAVLKNGLNRTTLGNNRLVPAHEKDASLPHYMDFNDNRFDNNIGVRTRGLGQLNKDTTFFIIKVDKPEPTLQDSVLYVENLLQEELALETAFEGNRFHDLMRIAIRRNDNDYLAAIVASKFKDPGKKAEIRSKLQNRENWYVK